MEGQEIIKMFEGVPLGDPVESSPASKPERRTLEGRYVTLVPIETSQAPSLYQTVCDESKPSVFPYMAVGPFDSQESFAKYIEQVRPSQDPLFFTIIPKEALPGIPARTPAGYLSLLSIDLTHRSIEIGHVTFSPALQRTTEATEALYLLMKHCMEDLGNRRLEWKCDSLNAKSRRAAERLGFTYEGLFRKHRIVRGKNRDTAWFSIIDDEWKDRAAVFDKWLDPVNFSEGGQVRSLEQIREDLGAGGFVCQSGLV
jgi:RimJ/RimL family protein N-acetyltransferase